MKIIAMPLPRATIPTAVLFPARSNATTLWTVRVIMNARVARVLPHQSTR